MGKHEEPSPLPLYVISIVIVAISSVADLPALGISETRWRALPWGEETRIQVAGFFVAQAFQPAIEQPPHPKKRDLDREA